MSLTFKRLCVLKLLLKLVASKGDQVEKKKYKHRREAEDQERKEIKEIAGHCTIRQQHNILTINECGHAKTFGMKPRAIIFWVFHMSNVLCCGATCKLQYSRKLFSGMCGRSEAIPFSMKPNFEEPPLPPLMYSLPFDSGHYPYTGWLFSHGHVNTIVSLLSFSYISINK